MPACRSTYARPSSRLGEAAATAAVRVANMDHLKSFEVQGLLEQIGCSPSRERQSASARQDPCSAGVRTKLSRTVMIASLHPYIRLQERDGWMATVTRGRGYDCVP